MRDYSGRWPGAAVRGDRDGQALVRRGYGLADLEAGDRRDPGDQLPPGLGDQAVHRRGDAAAGRGRPAALDDPVRQVAALAAAAPRRATTAPAAHAHRRADRLRGPDRARCHRAGPRRRRAAPAGRRRTASISRPAAATATATAATRCWRWWSARRRARTSRRSCASGSSCRSGMTDTVAYEDGISTVADRAYGYSFEDGAWRRTDQSLTSAVLGDGGIYSSIDDLAKWDAALYDDRLLGAASRGWRFAPQRGPTSPTSRLRLRLAHPGDTLGIPARHRFPQRDRALAAAAPQRAADQPQRPRALYAGARHCQGVPAGCRCDARDAGRRRPRFRGRDRSRPTRSPRQWGRGRCSSSSSQRACCPGLWRRRASPG